MKLQCIQSNINNCITIIIIVSTIVYYSCTTVATYHNTVTTCTCIYLYIIEYCITGIIQCKESTMFYATVYR